MHNPSPTDQPDGRIGQGNQSVPDGALDETLANQVDATRNLPQENAQDILPEPFDEAVDAALLREIAGAIKGASFVSEHQPLPLPILQSVINTVTSELEMETAIHFIRQSGNPTTVVSGSEQQLAEKQRDEFEMREKLLGSYRILRRLGQGGMGVVYEAEDTVLKRRVALKLMKAEAAAVPDNRIRFMREAQAAAKVTHDYICPIYQVGESEGMPFIAMPLLRGETLEHRMDRQPLTVLESLEVLRQSAEGVAAAHAAGLVHRDIKPSNIWLEERADGAIRVRILDFGLARFDVEESMTLLGMVLGTPAYMAPEQARGEVVDPRADLFSLGAVAYQMLAGKRAFAGSGTMEVLAKILNHDPALLESETPGVPESLSNLVQQLLQKNVVHRTSSAQQLLEQIKLVQAELPLESLQTIEQSVTATKKLPATSTKPDIRRSVSSGRGTKSPVRNWLVGTGLFAFLLLMGVIIFRTPNGTLVVEFEDSADIRVKDGQLQIHDEYGKLHYTLQPNSNSQRLATGSYQVNVAGADGLTVDTEKFEMKRGETVVVRVTAKSNAVAERPRDPAPSVPALTAVQFPGKSIINEAFNNPQLSQLPITDNSTDSTIIDDGVYIKTKVVDAALKNLTLQVGSHLRPAAFVTQCRTTNGFPFINFCILNDGEKSRYLSLALRNGDWHLYLARQDFEEGKWVIKPSTELASDNFIDPQLMPGQWIEVAARWSGEDYDLWLNGKHKVGGALPEELKSGTAGPIQICAKTASAGVSTIQLASLKVWDQSGIEPSQTVPIGLPERPQQ